MISAQRLARVRIALRIVRRLELPPEQWDTVLAIVRSLKRALLAGDEDRLGNALAQLERMGASRGTGGDPGHEVAGADLLAELDDADRELRVTAAEIRRTPHMDLDAPEVLRSGDEFTAMVYLDAEPSMPGEAAEAFLLPDPPEGLDELTVDVWLTGTLHFRVQSPTASTIVVRPQEDRSTTAGFRVSVCREVPADAGPPALRAIFSHNLRSSGMVQRTVPLADPGGPPAPDVAARPGLAGRHARGRARLHSLAAAPDLELQVARTSGGSDRFQVRIRSTLLGGLSVDDEWILDEGSEAYVKRVMAGFTDPKATALARRRSLEGAGMTFFDAAPRRFRELYWRMIDAGTPPRSMFLVSDERAIPWELMKPRRRRADGSTEIRPALGVGCAIGRWHDDEFMSPCQRIELYDSLVLAPDYAAGYRLPHAAAERDLVLGQYPGQNVPDTFDELDKFYATNSASVLHFVCHGRDDTLQSLRLRDEEVLSAQQVESGGLGSACRTARPLVFLNACEVGRPGAGLAGVGGFPAAFIKSDAGGIVAPLWAVDDAVAHQVSRAFYAAVAAEPTRAFADVLRELRARAYAEDGADSFAAYCYYGDPLTAAERA